VVYGRFPSEMIEVQAAMVLDWVSRDPWLISQIKTMKNAYKAYFKSRSKASPQSVKRFKQLPPEAAIHPWIQQKLGSEAVLRIDMVSELKTFRPATQIFKMSSKSGTGRAGTVKVDPRVVAHRAARPTETVDRFDSDAAAAAQPGVGSTAAAPLKQGGVAPTGGKLSKRAKRKGAQHRQQALPQGQKPTATGRDEAFFIEHRPENAFVEDSLRVNNSDSGVHDNRTAIEEAVINLVNDDSALKKRSTMQWDKRKMKYIETNSTSTKGKRGIEIKNEAGVVISTKSRKTGKERPSFYQVSPVSRLPRACRSGDKNAKFSRHLSSLIRRDPRRDAAGTVPRVALSARRGQNWVEKTNTRIPKAGTMCAAPRGVVRWRSPLTPAGVAQGGERGPPGRRARRELRRRWKGATTNSPTHPLRGAHDTRAPRAERRRCSWSASAAGRAAGWWAGMRAPAAARARATRRRRETGWRRRRAPGARGSRLARRARRTGGSRSSGWWRRSGRSARRRI
jgi:hypothetical protein